MRVERFIWGLGGGWALRLRHRALFLLPGPFLDRRRALTPPSFHTLQVFSLVAAGISPSPARHCAFLATWRF